jgi:D-alanine-D-alanine ligase
MRVAIAFSQQRDAPDTDLGEAVEHLSAALLRLGHTVVTVPLQLDVPAFVQALNAAQPDVIWNLCEELGGRPGREPHAAALCELIDVPVTGASSLALALCLDKSRCRHLLAAEGVPVPAGVRVDDPEQMPLDLPLPAVVKPTSQDGSTGIDRDSFVDTPEAAQNAVRRLVQAGLGPALIEHFVAGRELNSLLLGPVAGPLHYVAFGEVSFVGLPPGEPAILTWAAKWQEDSPAYQATPVHYPARLDPALAAEIRRIGDRAYVALGLSGYARLDLRVDGDGRPWVIDVNPNPDMSPDAGLVRALPTVGLTFDDFVARQLAWAWVK